MKTHSMPPWKLRLTGVLLMTVGGGLFVWSVKYISAEWPQIFVGLLSVFFCAIGFGLLVMPMESTTDSAPPP